MEECLMFLFDFSSFTCKRMFEKFSFYTKKSELKIQKEIDCMKFSVMLHLTPFLSHILASPFLSRFYEKKERKFTRFWGKRKSNTNNQMNKKILKVRCFKVSLNFHFLLPNPAQTIKCYTTQKCSNTYYNIYCIVQLQYTANFLW